MSVLTTEVLLFEANDAFRKDPNLPTSGFKHAIKAQGVHTPLYYGKQIEEPCTWGYVFLNWDNYEAHQAFRDGPSHPRVIEGLKQAFADGGKLEKYHVKFSGPTIALEKPVTEVLILALKEPENREAVVDILSKISEASDRMLVFGQTREEENKYILIGGWPTVEAHWETVAKPEVTKALDKLYSLADKKHLYHVKLSQYQL